MQKEEILAKSRKENNNELEARTKDNAIKLAFMVLVIVSAVFSAIRSSQGENVLDLPVIICSAVAAFHLYSYIRLREKSYLMLAIITGAAGIICLIAYNAGL